MVGGVKVQELAQYLRRCITLTETKERATHAVQTAEEWSVVGEPPREHTVEVHSDGQGANRDARLVVPKRKRWPVPELVIPQGRVRFETAQVERQDVRQ